MNDDIPKLRSDIEFVPTSHKGEQAVLVRDSLGLVPEPVMLHGDSLQMLQLIDGRNSIQDIQLIIMRNSGNVFVAKEAIRNYLHELDDIFLLESSRYQEHKRKLIDEYASSKIREAHLAGKVYPEDGEELSSYLETMVTEGGELADTAELQDIRALIAPHIDLELGRRLYGMAYHSVRKISPRRVVLLGTGHTLRGAFFSITSKDFVTPLGTVTTDKAAVASLRDSCGELLCPHDLDHRHEHSLEFQLIFLQYLFGEEFTLVPLLCGSFHWLLNSVSRPADIPEMAQFLQSVRELIQEDSSTLLVAGVDLSHIGLKFGHGQPASDLIEQAKVHDQRLLAAMCRGEVQEFWEESRRVEDRYHVCGLSALACLLELAEPAQGRVLGYDFWQEEETQSAVSFAAAVLTTKV